MIKFQSHLQPLPASILVALMTCVCLSWGVSAENADALGKRVKQETSLQYVVLRPVSLNQYDRETRRIYYDPTIIPYSGWHFFGPDGTPQPWRKRLLELTHHRALTGGLAESTRFLPQVDLVWTHPVDSPYWVDAIQPTNEMGWQPQAEYSSGGGGSSKHRFGTYYFETKAAERLPETFDFALTYLHGEWEKIAQADINTPLPVGNEHMQLTYLGEPRLDSPAVKQVIQDEFLEEDLAEFPYSFEFETVKKADHPHWKYEFQWDYDGQDGAGGMTYEFGNSTYRLWTIKPKNFKSAWIRRMAQAHTKLDPVDLKWLKNFKPEQLKQQRIQIDETDRFTEPRQLKEKMSSSAPGASCLLDLDSLTVHRMPDPMPEGEALAMLYEDLGADLRIYEDDGRTMRVSMLGCSSFILDQQSWDRTPAECISRASHGDWRIHQTYWPAWRGKGAVLVTTTEGGTVLLRVTESTDAAKDQPGVVQIEVRELEARRVGQLTNQ